MFLLINDSWEVVVFKWEVIVFKYRYILKFLEDMSFGYKLFYIFYN